MWKDRLKQAWNENPVAVVGVGALAVTAASKLIDTVSAAQSRHAYTKQVNYRVKHKR